MASSVADVERVNRELLRTYFAEHSLPIPEIKLVNRIGTRYLARCSWRPGTDNTVFDIQRSVLGDEPTLRRVLTHELVHHWEFLRTDQTRARALARMGIRDDGHGDLFKEYAARINATAGEGYVSRTSDQSYDTSKAPPYYILIEPHAGKLSAYGYTIAIRPSAAQKVVIDKKRQTRAARLFKITDGRFLNGGPIKSLGGYSIPRDPEHAAALATLYVTGKEA